MYRSVFLKLFKCLSLFLKYVTLQKRKCQLFVPFKAPDSFSCDIIINHHMITVIAMVQWNTPASLSVAIINIFSAPMAKWLVCLATCQRAWVRILILTVDASPPQMLNNFFRLFSSVVTHSAGRLSEGKMDWPGSLASQTNFMLSSYCEI